MLDCLGSMNTHEHYNNIINSRHVVEMILYARPTLAQSSIIDADWCTQGCKALRYLSVSQPAPRRSLPTIQPNLRPAVWDLDLIWSNYTFDACKCGSDLGDRPFVVENYDFRGWLVFCLHWGSRWCAWLERNGLIVSALRLLSSLLEQYYASFLFVVMIEFAWLHT